MIFKMFLHLDWKFITLRHDFERDTSVFGEDLWMFLTDHDGYDPDLNPKQSLSPEVKMSFDGF